MRSLALAILMLGCGDPAPAPEPAPEPEPEPEPEPATEPEPEPAPAPEPEPEHAEASRVLPDLPRLSASVTRLDVGPWCESPECAAALGLASGTDDAEPLVAVEHGRETWVLVAAPDRDEELGRLEERRRRARWNLWLVRAREHTDADEGVGYRREAAVRLYVHATSMNESSGDCEAAIEPEVRARDLDGDGEVEVTAIFGGYAATAPMSFSGIDAECGTVAFIVGADLNVQAAFTREYHFVQYDAGGEDEEHVLTAWRVTDVNGDGHADLHVTERSSTRFDFEGDWDGLESAPGEHARDSNRKTVDCLYVPGTDIWQCDSLIGRAFFRDVDAIRGGRRPTGG